jgi:hypothetical protein
VQEPLHSEWCMYGRVQEPGCFQNDVCILYTDMHVFTYVCM